MVWSIAFGDSLLVGFSGVSEVGGEIGGGLDAPPPLIPQAPTIALARKFVLAFARLATVSESFSFSAYAQMLDPDAEGPIW
jgi:hypothetical protein